MKEWVTPLLVIGGLMIVGFAIRSIIKDRSAKTDTTTTTQAQQGEGGDDSGGPGGPGGSEGEPGQGEDRGEKPDRDSEQDWEDTHHAKSTWPSEPAPRSEIMITIPKGKAEFGPESMVKVPAGDFTMGDDQLDTASPKRQAFVKAFEIDRYEVNRTQYQKFIQATGHRQPSLADDWAAPYSWREKEFPKNTPTHPVTLVSYNDAMAYCKWAGKRLPTETEWEKAARGPDGRRYPWPGKWDGRMANTLERLSGPLTSDKQYQDFMATAENQVQRPFPTGAYPEDKSPYGAMDMHGNVQEWVDSPFEAYEGGNDKASELFDKKGIMVVRGQSYLNRDYGAPLATRYPYEAELRDLNIGFRCAKDN